MELRDEYTEVAIIAALKGNWVPFSAVSSCEGRDFATLAMRKRSALFSGGLAMSSSWVINRVNWSEKPFNPHTVFRDRDKVPKSP